MERKIAWLPDLVLFENYNGNWGEYIDALYKIFKYDFIDKKPTYNGIRLSIRKRPFTQGKETTFWHITSIGKNEDERQPELRRCERIRWPKPIIEKERCTELKIWENKRKNDENICLFLDSENYIVILTKRKDYILFKTAYYIEQNHRKRKLLKEYDEWVNKNQRRP